MDSQIAINGATYKHMVTLIAMYKQSLHSIDMGYWGVPEEFQEAKETYQLMIKDAQSYIDNYPLRRSARIAARM